jgi:hypothetical protein
MALVLADGPVSPESQRFLMYAFYCYSWGRVRLNPLDTPVTAGLLYQPRMFMMMRNSGWTENWRGK